MGHRPHAHSDEWPTPFTNLRRSLRRKVVAAKRSDEQAICLPSPGRHHEIAMSTHLSRHFEQQRIVRGLRPGQLAALAGCTNTSKIGNRIRQFELTGDIGRELFEKLVAALDIEASTIERLVEQDRREFFRVWLAWVNEPIKPYLVQRLMAAVYRQISLPDEITTQDEAEAWAAGIAREWKRKCCLVWSRRISIWFDADGNAFRGEAVPGKPNVPWLKIGGKTFNFGEDLGSTTLVQWPHKRGVQE